MSSKISWEKMSVYAMAMEMKDWKEKSKGPILGLNPHLFLFLYLVMLASWLACLYYLVKHWDMLSNLFRALILVGLVPVVPFGPVLSAVVLGIHSASMSSQYEKMNFGFGFDSDSENSSCSSCSM
jgi:hypothetical protein